MRYVAAAGIVACFVGGCAQGDDKKVGVTADSSTDVATIEIGGDDTSADGGPEDSGSAPDSASDTTSADAADSAPDTLADSASDGAADAEVSDAATAWSHTIAIDGTNDFATGEKFETTSKGTYDAFVTWDDTYLYFAMQGADIGTTTSPNKWVLLYVDADPGASTGATSGVKYNTQTPVFPSGFGAEYYLRWKTDDSYRSIEQYAGTTWSTSTATLERARSGNYVEFRVKRSDLGSPAKLGLELFMLNETGLAEAAYAGIYDMNFADGYHASIPFTKYLYVDFAATTAPNDTSRIKP